MIRKTLLVALAAMSLAVTALGMTGYWKKIVWTINGPAPGNPDFLQTGKWRPGPTYGGALMFEQGSLVLTMWHHRWQRPLSSDEVRAALSGALRQPFTDNQVRLPFRVYHYTSRSSRADLLASPPCLLGWSQWTLIAPFWVPAVILAFVPTLVLVGGIPRRRRARRRKLGLCLRCGYNLTGNTSGVCPECGTGAGPP